MIGKPLAIALADDSSAAMDAGQSTFGGERPQHFVRQPRTGDGANCLMTGHDGSAAGLNQLHVRSLGAVCNVDQNAESIHLAYQRTPALIDTVEVIRLLPA